MRERRGHCLCGAIEILATDADDKVGACHCKTCRRWGGGPYMEIECGTAVEFVGAENITVFDSSDWAERGFCKHCGTHLFYRLKGTGQYSVPVGLFPDDEELEIATQAFVEEKPSFYAFSNKTKEMTGAELFARFSQS